MTTYQIPEENLPKLEAHIAQLAKRAAKLGCEPPTIQVGDHTTRDHPVYDNLLIKVFEVEVEGQAPVINGWHFVARIEHLPNGNVLYTAPQEPQPIWARTVEPKCDHCKVNRYRKDTFLIRNGTDIKQVGSSCLKDFTGHKNPHGLAAMAEMIALLDEFASECEEYDPEASSGKEWLYKTTVYLSYVCQAIAAHGWVSKGKAMPEVGVLATANVAAYNMNSAKAETPQTKHTDEASAVLEWARQHFSPERGNLNDYEWNVSQVISQDALCDRWLGLVASVVPAYHRKLQQELEAENKCNEYVGEVKQRLMFENLTVVFVRALETMYGVSNLIKMEDAEGHTFVWFASNFWPDQGDVLSGKGTIKKHEPYNGVKQTVLTRCKFEVVE